MQTKLFSTKRIVLIAILGISIWILIPKIIGLKDTVELLNRVIFWAFILALLSEFFFYIGSAILTQTVLKMTKDKLSFWDVLKISVMDSFSVQFLPLGTLGEAAVDYYFYRAKNIRTTHIFLMFVARTIIVWLVFGLIYLVGVAFAPSNGELSGDKLLIIWLIYAGGVGVFTYFIYLYSKRWLLLKRANRFVEILNFFANLFHRNKISLDKIPGFVDKIYEAIWILSQNIRLQITAGIGALFFWFGDIFCLYFAFLGFGYSPHLAIVIFTYAVAKIISTLSFIPGGLGITEAIMSLIFIGFGIPAPIALAAVLIFRLISFWLPIPVGFVSFLSLQRNYNKIKVEGII